MLNKRKNIAVIIFLVSILVFFTAVYDAIDLAVSKKYYDDASKSSAFILAEKNNALLLVQTSLSMFLSIINIRK